MKKNNMFHIAYNIHPDNFQPDKFANITIFLNDKCIFDGIIKIEQIEHKLQELIDIYINHDK